MSQSSNGRKFIVTITLQERYLLITGIVRKLREMRTAKKVFVETRSARRAAEYAILHNLPDFYPGVRSLIVELQGLLHHQSDIVTNVQLQSLLDEADAYAKKAERIYKGVVRDTSSWPPASIRQQVHQKAHQISRMLCPLPYDHRGAFRQHAHQRSSR